MTDAEKIAAAIGRRAAGITRAGSKAAWVAGLLSAATERVVDEDTGVTVDVELSADDLRVAGGVVVAVAPRVVVRVKGRYVCPVGKSSGSTLAVGSRVLAVKIAGAVVVVPVEVL